MNRSQSTARRLIPALGAIVALLLVSGLASAQGTPPQIPHPLEGRDACLACHETGLAGAPQVPADHAGRTNEMCRGCHQPAMPATVGTTATSSASGTAVAPPVESTPAVSGTVPAIPHPLEGRDDCLACHREGLGGAPQVPPDHEGRTSETCRGCHQPAIPIEAASTETPSAPTASATPSGAATPEAFAGPPAIPHPLAGRDDCLACHREGIGGAPQISQDHEGRTNDVCQTCHLAQQATMVSPTPAPVNAVPTRIAHPTATTGVNTCADCHTKLGGTHADIVAQWQVSVHAERDVSCADCHGGDPNATSQKEAMSPAAGFVGVPDKSAIPALCASCHADVESMRQYNLPTDQYAKYNESVHGKLLAEGDTNVSTCYDCHGGHKVLRPNDPASTVYPANVPALCAGCHSDKELMAPYHIPTDQYDLYKGSVHGQALLDEQNFRAPTCATCHGTHGATPPGVTEVANVCGNCHGATQDYFLKSAHAKGGDAAPKCVTCHGHHDVHQPNDALLTGTDPRHCDACHSPDSAEGKVAQTLYDAFDSTTKAYTDAENSIKSAQQLGMLVTQQESQLQQANTGIITARAAQHTLDTNAVLKSLDDARKSADSAKAGALDAIAQSVLRRRAMVIAVVVIALVVVALYLLKRQLDRRLKDSTKP
jgi:hypothetical protein